MASKRSLIGPINKPIKIELYALDCQILKKCKLYNISYTLTFYLRNTHVNN